MIQCLKCSTSIPLNGWMEVDGAKATLHCPDCGTERQLNVLQLIRSEVTDHVLRRVPRQGDQS